MSVTRNIGLRKCVKVPMTSEGEYSMAVNALMTELTPEVLKELHEVQIEILEDIVRICKKYHLRYFMIYGTLIGAIRHKGFIPWDDDLDVGMPRDDYEKFIEIARKELDEKYYLQNSDSDSGYWLPFAKVRKHNTLFEEPSVAKMSDKVHKGIFVDIFPFDYVQKNKGYFVHSQFVLSKAINETMYYKAGVFTNKNVLKYKHIVTVLNLLPMRALSKLQRRVASMQNKKKAQYFADFNSSRKYLAAIYPLTWFLPTAVGEFNGRKFDIPRNYDLYLRMVYGDYMKMPKEEERVNHRTIRIVF